MQAITDTAVAARGGATLAGPAVGNPTAEIKDLMVRFYEAMSQGNFVALDRLLSHRDGLLWIGTDPYEWWETPEAAFQAWREQMAEASGPLSITGSNATAYENGEVAWVADRPVFHLPGGRSFPFRLTAVWVREPEGWRLVQVHTSMGVANESVLQPG